MQSGAMRSVAAVAEVRGGKEYPKIRGTVKFYSLENATLVIADIKGLPKTRTGFFAFHIHEGTSCGGEDFAETKGHYNPNMSLHPDHAGDLTPLMRSNGNAFSAVVTDRFTPSDIVGRTVVIHSNPDDFITQPSGNAGKKIACGVIRRAAETVR